jgi:hypothetical protein
VKTHGNRTRLALLAGLAFTGLIAPVHAQPSGGSAQQAAAGITVIVPADVLRRPHWGLRCVRGSLSLQLQQHLCLPRD